MKDLLDRLFVRLPEIRALAGSLGHARERLALERQDPEALALATVRTSWRDASQQAAPAFLVADLLAECWTVLAEEALVQGAPDRCRLALQLAEAAFAEGSGDPHLVGSLHRTWAFYHRARGEKEEARQRITRLRTAAEAIDDPHRLAEADLWTYLFEREQGRDLDAQAALRLACWRLAKKERSELLAGMVERLERMPMAPGSKPRPEPPPGPIANGQPPTTPDPALEDTWVEPMPAAEPNH